MVYVYLGLLLGCYLSFWYSSLKIFKPNNSKKSQYWYLLRVLTLLVWYGSFIEIAYLKNFRIEPSWSYAGSIICFMALILFWLAAYHIKGKNFLAIFNNINSSLEVNGPYRYLRHPFYSAYILCYASILVVTESIFLFVAVVALNIYYIWAARNEEQSFLMGPYKEKYLAYVKKTGMFFPRIF